MKAVVTEKRPENLLTLLAKEAFDVVLLDMNFMASINTGNEGIYWLRELRKAKFLTALQNRQIIPLGASAVARLKS